jgi:hypothetical protein
MRNELFEACLDVHLQTLYAVRQYAVHYKYTYALVERIQGYKRSDVITS